MPEEETPPPAVGDHGPESPTAAPPQLSGPKRQHFLPRFYLEGFADHGGLLAVYDRESDSVRRQQPINTGVIGHFYTLEDAQGRKRFELETFLAELEGKASIGVRKLIAREELSADQRADVAIFIALAAFRTPDIIDSIKLSYTGMIGQMIPGMFSDVEAVKERMRGRPGSPEAEDELHREAQELVDFARSGAYEITADHKWAVGVAIQVGLDVAPTFAGRSWLVIERDDEKKSFVTSDAPVVLGTILPRESSMWGVGFGSSDALVLFPLSGSHALALYGNDGDLTYVRAAAESIRRINLAMSERCQRFLIGRDEQLLRSLADQVSLATTEWQPKLQARR